MKKLSFKGMGQFLERTWNEGPEKLGYALGREAAAAWDNPVRWARQGFVKNGRAMGGISYLIGDTSLGSSGNETMLAQGVGLLSIPATLLFIAEPKLGQIFGKNERNQPLVPMGKHTLNTSKLSYNVIGVTVGMLTLDGLLHVPGGIEHLKDIDWNTVKEPAKEVLTGVAPFLQVGASAIAAWGCFQAGAKDKTAAEVKELPVKKTLLGKAAQDSEISGVFKLLAENAVMVTAAIGMGRMELLLAYGLWSLGNFFLGSRRVVELHQKSLPPPPKA